MITSYKTLASPSEGQFKDRGSKFLAFSYPVKDENEIKEKIDLLKKQYHDARHHCYAWKVGTDTPQLRANDDGEPANSAGKPILNQIEHFKLTNILIVVVRYFGGSLLGIGGLINAYRTASINAIENSRIINISIKKEYLLEFQYPETDRIMKIVKDYSLDSFDQHFEITSSLKVRIELKKVNEILEKLDLIQGCTYKYLGIE
jgi:uncharacterized YigZ family protein